MAERKLSPDSRFPADAVGVATALHTAFHMDACVGSTVVAAPRPAAGPQLGGYHGAALEVGASTLFVSPGGSDASGDGSEAKPFATLQKAQAAVRIGIVGYIRL